MVKLWDEMLAFEIQRTKRRIALAEKHGIGKMAMQEKARLLIQQKTQADRKI